MISFRLLIYTLGFAGLYLFTMTILLNLIERRLKLTESIPKEMLESYNFSWLFINFMMESLFYVVIPTILYSFFYFVVPFSGVRAGLAATLFAFAIGAVPAVMSLSVRVRLPMPYLLFIILSLLLKLGGALAIIGYLYSL